MKDEERRKKKKKPEGYIDLFAEDDEEEEVSVGSLFDDDDEAAMEDASDQGVEEAAEEEAAADDGDEEAAEPAHTDYTMPLPTDEEANYVEPDEAFDRTGSASREDFTFDRYGRRTGKVPRKKRPRERYGKRKHAKKATTTLLLNETEVRREREEAQKRASERDKLRQKQRRLESEQRRARRKVEMKKRMYALLVLLGLFVLLILAGYFTFLIRSIDVVGTLTRYSKEELIEASGLKLQRHILLQDLDEAQENLRRDPYLNVTVKYVFPNRIRITLEERGRAGAVAWGPNKEYIAVIDRTGTVLESDASSYRGLPLVQGLIITGATRGGRAGPKHAGRALHLGGAGPCRQDPDRGSHRDHGHQPLHPRGLSHRGGGHLGFVHKAEPAQEELHRHHGQGHPVHGAGCGQRDHLPVQQERRGHLPP